MVVSIPIFERSASDGSTVKHSGVRMTGTITGQSSDTGGGIYKLYEMQIDGGFSYTLTASSAEADSKSSYSANFCPECGAEAVEGVVIDASPSSTVTISDVPPESVKQERRT